MSNIIIGSVIYFLLLNSNVYSQGSIWDRRTYADSFYSISINCLGPYSYTRKIQENKIKQILIYEDLGIDELEERLVYVLKGKFRKSGIMYYYLDYLAERRIKVPKKYKDMTFNMPHFSTLVSMSHRNFYIKKIPDTTFLFDDNLLNVYQLKSGSSSTCEKEDSEEDRVYQINYIGIIEKSELRVLYYFDKNYKFIEKLSEVRKGSLITEYTNSYLNDFWVKSNYTYNTAGGIVKMKVEFHPSLERNFYVLFKLNERDMPIERSFYAEDGKLIRRQFFKYKYYK